MNFTIALNELKQTTSNSMLESNSGKAFATAKYLRSEKGRLKEKSKKKGQYTLKQRQGFEKKAERLGKSYENRLKDLQPNSGIADAIDNATDGVALGLAAFKATVPKQARKMVSIIEDIILSCITLSGCDNPTSATTCIFSLVKSLVGGDESVTLTVIRAIFGDISMTAIMKYFTTISEEEDSKFRLDSTTVGMEGIELEANSAKVMQLNSWLGNMFDAMNMAKNSRLIHKIVKLISILIAAGLVGNSNKLTLTYAGLQLFSIQAAKEAATGSNVFDLISCSFEILHLFASKLYVCFERRSLMPMFLDHYGGDQYWKDYTSVLAEAPDFLIGKSSNRWPTLGTFMAEIELLLQATERMVAMAKDVEKRVLKDHFVKLKQFKMKGQALDGDGKIREMPFTFLIHGPSSAGKTTITNIGIDFSLKKIAFIRGNKEFVTQDRHIAMINEQDEYDTNYKSYTLAVWEDDMANGCFDKAKGNPAANAIRYVNNAPAKAVKADIEEKGKIPIEPLVYCATTNVPDAWAKAYSNAPESGLRRYQLHIGAKIKDEWVKKVNNLPPGVKVSKLNHERMVKEAENGNFHPDAWEFTVTEWLPVTEGTPVNKLTKQCKPIERDYYFIDENGEEKAATNIGMADLLRLFSQEIESHLKVQSSVVSSTKGLRQQKLCPHALYKRLCPICRAEALKEGKLEDNVDVCQLVTDSTVNVEEVNEEPTMEANSWQEAEKELSGYERTFSRNYRLLTRLRKNPVLFSLACLPESITKNPMFVGLHAIVEQERIVYRKWFIDIDIPLPRLLTVLQMVFFLFLGFWIYAIHEDINVRLAGAVTLGFLFFAMLYTSMVYCVAYRRVSSNRQIITKFVENSGNVAKGYGKYLAAGTSAVIGMLSIYKLWKMFRRNNTFTYTNSAAKFVNDQSEPNVWLQKRVVPISKEIDNNQLKHVINKVSDAQIIVRYLHESESFSNGFIVDSGELLIPVHEAKRLQGTRLRLSNAPDNVMTGINHITPPLGPEDWTYVGKEGETDIAMVAIASLGKKCNLKNLFSPEYFKREPLLAKCIVRNPSFELEELNIRIDKYGEVNTRSGVSSFKHGAFYAHEVPAFQGMCMASNVYIHSTKAFIHSFHLAGENKVNGLNAAQLITKDEVIDASKRLHANSCVHPKVASAAPIKTVLYDKDFTPITPKGVTNLDHQVQCQAEYYGNMPGAFVAPRSSVIDSPILKEIEKEFNVKQMYGPPPNCRRKEDGKRVIPTWEPYRLYLSGVGNAHQEFPTPVLKKAALDYLGSMCEAIESDEEIKQYAAKLHILDPIRTVSGEDGTKFVDAMKSGTSMGWPLNKPKRDFLTDIAEEVEGVSCPKKMADMVVEQATYDELERYAKGLSANPIFKNCTKDEPTKLTKEKARVYQAAPAHFQLNVRKYFLPVAAFMSRYPLIFECAVGVNSQGPQWNKLIKHISKYGPERMVAGDFKAYDQHMSGRMILIAMNIMCDLAEKYMDYSEKEISIMRIMASDIAYPLVSINGDLTQLFGSNPSGQNLTVYVNSIVNSLYQRCVFFVIYPDFKDRFNEHVALTTYGDDNAMSCSEHVPKYNHTEMQKVYNDHDIEFTMAQKEAESVPYIDINNMEFLKRWSRWEPNLIAPGTKEKGMWIAKLDEDSIFKSLMSNLKSKEEDQHTVAIQCIDGALREWFFHGEEFFNDKLAKMERVVTNMDYNSWMPKNWNLPYAARREEWKSRYGIIEE